MSDYTVVPARHILIPKIAAQAQQGLMSALLTLATPGDDSFHNSVVTTKLRKIWFLRNAPQAFCAATLLSRCVRFVAALADQLLNQSNWLRYSSA